MRVVIAEDEPLARDHLHRILRDAGVDVAACCTNGVELVAAVASLRPDAVFVDVEMPELDGLMAVASIPPGIRPQVVFVTAFDGFAVRAFDLEAADYVLKPFRKERIVRSIERLQRVPRSAGAAPAGERFIVAAAGKLTVITEAEIEAVEAAGNYVRLHARASAPLLRETIRSLEARLTGFVRTHRSWLAHVSSMREIRSRPSGDHDAIMASGARVPVSRNFRDTVLTRLRKP